jgi:ribosomal protein S18 acetylase RimI-like enzyme
VRSPNQHVIVEPFDPDRHDRAGFSSGVDSVDNFFKRTANKLASAGNIRLFVMTSLEGDLMGFYALNASAIDYTDLPAKYARTRPGHGSIPVAYISMVAVDQRYAGLGHGSELVADALKRIASAAENVGIALVVLDILDDGNATLVERRRALYQSYGFTPMPTKPLRLFLPVAAIDDLLAE